MNLRIRKQVEIGLTKMLQAVDKKYPDHDSYPYRKVVLFVDGSGEVGDSDPDSISKFSFNSIEELTQHLFGDE